MADFYIDGTNLNNATAVYQDAALTQCSPAGFYSDGISVREQTLNGSFCQLLPPQVCPSCATPCGTQISGSGGQGVYNLTMDVGGTATDTGAIIVMFDPIGVPDGVMAVYDGVVYNTLSSPSFGLLTGTAGSPLYVGNQGQDCGISGSTYSNIAVYQYQGSGFVNTNQPTTIQVNAGQLSLTSGAPGDCIMVIPKPNASPATINFTFIGPCATTGWNFNVTCPAALNGIIASSPQNQASDACTALLNTTIYHVPVAGTAQTQVRVNDYIFSDVNGQTPATSGWYLHPYGSVYQVGPSGVVTTVQNGCNTLTVTDCNNNNLYTMNDRFASNTLGDVIQYKRINQSTFQIEPTVQCGTITATGTTGTYTNAVQESPISRACDDTSHCP